MRFAICNETFQQWPLDQAFALAQASGYTGIELAPFTLGASAYAIPAHQRAEVRRLAERAELEVVGLHWLLAKTEGYYLTSPDVDVRRRTSEYLGELARLCRDVGGRILVLGSPQQRNLRPGVTHDHAMVDAAEVIDAAVPALVDCQVTLAVEPLGPEEGNFLMTADAACQLLDLINSPQVRLHLDVKAMSSEEKGITEIIHDCGPRIAHFHANDPNRRGPGMGVVDFVPIFRALRDVSYQGWISVEVFDYSPGIHSLVQESIQYMQRCAAALADDGEGSAK
jgi:sugar phosphate isomerase/epimerase